MFSNTSAFFHATRMSHIKHVERRFCARQTLYHREKNARRRLLRGGSDSSSEEANKALTEGGKNKRINWLKGLGS